MPSRAMHSHGNRIKEIIRAADEIHKYELIELAGISLSTYEKLKPWLLWRFPDFVSYDRTTMIWKWEVGDLQDNEKK